MIGGRWLTVDDSEVGWGSTRVFFYFFRENILLRSYWNVFAKIIYNFNLY